MEETRPTKLDGTTDDGTPSAYPPAQPEAHAPLVDGSLWSAIWIMSWPLLLTTIAASLVGLVDVQVSGYLGSSVQAAVGLAEHVIFMFSVIPMSVSAGTTAIVARCFGAKDLDGTIHATGQSLSFALGSGVLLAITSLFFARYLLPLFAHSGNVVDAGELYLSIYGVYLIPFSFICIANSAFRAIGDARTPLIVVAVEVLINIIGDYATVLGNWPVPGLGIRGIAGSAVVSATIGALLAGTLLYRSSLKGSFGHLRPDWQMQKRIIKIGIPSALQRLSWTASVFVMFFILKKLAEPTAALASWTIGIRIEAMLFMPLVALAIAVSSIVGQNLGAKQVDRAIKAGWHMTGIGVVMMIILGAVLFVFSEPLAAFMSKDSKTIAITASYLRINALAEPFLAVTMVLGGALQGAGDTKSQMWMSIFTNWIIRLPLAWYLCLNLNLGPDGAWFSMVSSIVIFAVLISIRYQQGKWIETKV